MAFSRDQLRFVIRVIRDAKGHDDDSIGTGILVSPNAVITCAHNVLPEREWGDHKDQPTLVDADIGAAEIVVDIEGRLIPVQLSGDNAPKFDPQGEDLVLLTLEEEVDVTLAAFVTGFDEQTARELEKHRLDIYGFRKGAATLTPVEAKGSTISKEFADAGKQGLLGFGLLDRVIEGYSGGPVVISETSEPYCIGIATLGGEGRMAMVAIGSDFVDAFFHRMGNVPAKRIEATRVLPVRPKHDSRLIQFCVAVSAMIVSLFINGLLFYFEPPEAWTSPIKYAQYLILLLILILALTYWLRDPTLKSSRIMLVTLGLVAGTLIELVFPIY